MSMSTVYRSLPGLFYSSQGFHSLRNRILQAVLGPLCKLPQYCARCKWSREKNSADLQLANRRELGSMQVGINDATTLVKDGIKEE